MDRLHVIADLCKRGGACEEGVAWCLSHEMSDVAEAMPSEYAWWVIENLSLPPAERLLFWDATTRDKPRRAALIWADSKRTLSPIERAHLRSIASRDPLAEEWIQSGRLREGRGSGQ